MEERGGSAIQQNKRCLVRNRSIGNRGRDAKRRFLTPIKVCNLQIRLNM